jgi:hypothetical protein
MSTSAIDSLITAILDALAPISPVAKAVVPSAGALVVSLVNALIAGSFNVTSIVTLALGVVLSVVVYLVPNKAQVAQAPFAPASK